MRISSVLIVFMILLSSFTAKADFPSGISLAKILTLNEGLSNSSVLSIAVAPEMIFIGTERNLSILKKDGSIAIWGPQNSPLAYPKIPAVVVKGNEIWASCRDPMTGGGTLRFDGLQWYRYEEIKDDMQSNYVTCFHVDEKNVLWIGHESQGVNEFVQGTNPYKKFGYLATKKGLVNMQVNCLGSRSGELWIGTMGGVSIYKGKKDEKYLFTNFTTQNGLPNNVVLNLAVSPSIVYAGSPTGLMIFENEKWRAIGISEGLASDWVSALALDGENLWIGTKKGLQFLSNGKISTSMNFKNGFPSSHIQALAVRNNSDGSASIFVGTDEGLIVLNRERK